MQRITLRAFATTSVPRGVSAKAKVTAALKGRDILDTERLEYLKEKKRKDFNNTPVQDASAHKLLKDLLQRDFPEDQPIGPLTSLTAKELLLIFQQKNLRLQFKVLGTSGRQIQDSLTVDKDVQKFLKNGDLLKAKQLAKLARHHGIFAYGTIIQYLLQRGQINDAFEIFSNLKKRGYKPSGRLYNSLISGYADVLSTPQHKNSVSNLKIEQLYKAFQKDHADETSEVSIIHVNSLLKVFRKGKRVDLAFNLYDSLKEVRKGKRKLKPDVRTYTEMLRVLANAKPNSEIGVEFKDIVNRAETVFYNAQHNRHVKMDAYLVRAYLSIYAYCDDLKLRARAVTIIREWFRVSSLEEIREPIDYKVFDQTLWTVTEHSSRVLPENESGAKLLSFHEINELKSKRFDPDESILRMYRELCNLFQIPFTYREQSPIPAKAD
jgi:pentatricopeptide repeat protein